MKTIDKEQLSSEERQANVDRFLARWKESRLETQREVEAFAKTSAFQEMKKRLQEKNAKRGIIATAL